MNRNSISTLRLRLIAAATLITLSPTALTHAQSTTGDHSVKMNTSASQMLLRTTGGDLKYYNTADLSGVDIDKSSGSVRVSGKTDGWNDEFSREIAEISFSKPPQTGDDAEIVSQGVSISEARGWLEAAYLKWLPLEGATSYRVYIKGGKFADYTQIDRELVRDYGTYGRADMVGLPAGTYSMKVVPVIGGKEDDSQSAEARSMTVRTHDRSGFANFNHSGVGAYKDNGELKDNADVIYVTAENAKTVRCSIFYDKAEKEFVGLQAIIKALEKGTAKRPLAVRIIGCVRNTDMDELLSNEGIQVKGRKSTIPMNLTIEGIGDDATVWGFGFLLRNAFSVELRNFANMICMDDAISIDTNNRNCWVHHIDFFYGGTGSDKDQAKGDGSIDIKGNSQYITVAYNRFHDSGKTSLCGMKSESGPNYIDYHHNWFDHSDSRHPRVRTMTVHVWNNFYDGVAKYGAGAVSGASIFMENNFFRSSKSPMLINHQGTDAKGSGTFEDADGGVIKSFGNVYAEKGSSSNYTPITHRLSAADFDCYEAESRDEKIPDSYKAKAGGSIYDNFDTDPTLIYSYTPLPATDVPSVVTGFYGAGRLNHGDFVWDFNYPGADTDYNVISALKTALLNYKSSLKGIFE